MRNAKPLTAARPLVLIAALAAFGCSGPGGPTFSVTFRPTAAPSRSTAGWS